MNIIYTTISLQTPNKIFKIKLKAWAIEISQYRLSAPKYHWVHVQFFTWIWYQTTNLS